MTLMATREISVNADACWTQNRKKNEQDFRLKLCGQNALHFVLHVCLWQENVCMVFLQREDLWSKFVFKRKRVRE